MTPPEHSAGEPLTLHGRELGLLAPDAELHVPDGTAGEAALARVTELAIGAHPDDLEVLAYPGIEACYREADRWFGGIVLTHGVGGPSLDAGVEDLGLKRREEQRAAARLGEYGAVVQLGLASADIRGERPVAPVVDDLTRLLLIARPTTVYLHNPADRHESHVATLARSIEALRALPAEYRPQRVLGLEVWRDLDWATDGDRVELHVGRHPELATKLIAVFESQIAVGKRYDLAVDARRRAHATFSDSHSTDAADGLCLALDLTPCIQDDGPTLAERVGDAIDRLRDDVLSRLERQGVAHRAKSDPRGRP